MALVFATKNGNWSDTTVWNTGSLPSAADIVRPNNFTVTIDIDVTVTEIRNDAGGGAVVSGRFTLNDGITVTASNGFYGTYTAAAPQLLNYSGLGTIILNGDIFGVQANNLNCACLLVESNGTVTINGNITNLNSSSSGQSIRNTSSGNIIINGNITGVQTSIFNLSGTVTITGNITANGGTSITNTSGAVTVNGNLTSSGGALISNTLGTVTVTGNSTCVGSIVGRCIINDSGTVTVIGDIITSSAGNNQGHINILNSGSGTVNIIGEVFGAGSTVNVSNRCISNNSNGTINITGVVNGIAVVGTLASGLIGVATVFNGGTGTINVTGTVNNGVFTNTLQTFATIFNNGGTININGNVQGGDSLSINNYTSTSTTNINGNVIGGSARISVLNFVTGTVTVNGNAIGGTSWFAIEGVNAAGNTIIERAVYTAQGQSPITGYIKFKTTNPEIDVLREDSVIVTLRDPLNVSGLLPSPGDVRSGTTYNSGSSTGTLAMPAPNLVQLGVPVDNTVGTGNLTPQDFWDYLISNGFVGGSIGERLKNASTVDTTGAQIAGFIV